MSSYWSFAVGVLAAVEAEALGADAVHVERVERVEHSHGAR